MNAKRRRLHPQSLPNTPENRALIEKEAAKLSPWIGKHLRELLLIPEKTTKGPKPRMRVNALEGGTP